jgi:N-acyl-D-aspartate/D-glutamate deacylase
MSLDLLIRGGTVVDGSGMPGFRADVGVRDGKVVDVGRLTDSASRTIDADGLTVSPGFIDHHTHLDAQLFWDPYGTSEPMHGVTSVVMGNCALALAPVKDADRDELVRSFVRVEAMPRPALEAGVPWGWSSYGEYLDRLEGRLGINAGGLVGHIPIRHYVMGAEAIERPATDDEIEQMRALVAESLRGGALGISSNRNDRHNREDGRPIASRLANDDELFRLCDVLSELNAGTVQMGLGLAKIEQMAWKHELARRTGRPIIGQTVRDLVMEPDLWKAQLAELEKSFSEGYRTYGMSNTVPIVQRFNLRNSQRFDEFPTWKNVMFLPEDVRILAFRDPETRAKLHADLETTRHVQFHRRWDLVRIIHVGKPEFQKYLDKSIAEMAEMRGQHPVDAMIDVSLEDNLETTFWTTNTGADPVAAATILNSPYLLVGVSDAGAHVQFDAAFGYGTTLLGLWVRERGALMLERAVQKLSFEVASVYGIRDRGLLRPGYAADIAIFDPATVNACEPEWTEDYPANTRRLSQRAEGVHYTIVNGTVVQQDGALSGDLPGQVMRGAAYTARQSAAA